MITMELGKSWKDMSIIFKFCTNKGDIINAYKINEREFMVELINAFFKRERDKVTNKKGVHPDAKARREYAHHFLAGFGFSHDWIDDVKYVAKHNGVSK